MSQFNNSFYSIPIINNLSNSGKPLIIGIKRLKLLNKINEEKEVFINPLEENEEEEEINLKVEELNDHLLDTIDEDEEEIVIDQNEKIIIKKENNNNKLIKSIIPIIKIEKEVNFKIYENNEELNNIIIINEVNITLIINNNNKSTFLVENIIFENNNVYIEPFFIKNLLEINKQISISPEINKLINSDLNDEKQNNNNNKEEKEKIIKINIIENNNKLEKNKKATEIELCKMVEELKALQQIEIIKKEEINNNNNNIPIKLINNNNKQYYNYSFPFSSSSFNNNKIIIDNQHSPFGQNLNKKEEEENNWRLSPKTLCRIKKLNIIMETNGINNNNNIKEDSVDVIHHHPIFVKDTSRFWYKPKISREEAISMLKNKSPGTFIVRDSNSFPGAFGLALKVSQPPAGVSPADGNELVRHFLIEPSPKGVRLKGCSNEPVFGTLAALVYQHSITPLALPCRLILPSIDPASNPENINSNQALLERGAACNVTYLCSVDTESLTGPEAVRRSTSFALKLLLRNEVRAVPVHIKVSLQGITLTDNTRTLFFRRHYPVNSVTFAGIDPESRFFDNNNVIQLPPTYVRQATMFGFVAHKNANNGFNGGNNIENSCHIFAELDPDQPASAVVRFITNVMMPAGRIQLQQKHQ